MSSQGPSDQEASDMLIEAIKPKTLDRPKKLQSLIDTQAMRFLEAMDFQSYNDLSSAFDKFMMDAPLFQGDVSFSRAAAALDLTAQLFSTIDRDKNHLLSREEFAYLLLKTTEANRQALSWLIENFNAFTQACFFKDQISRDDIEAARNVFHGLKIAKDKFGFDKEPTAENLQYLNEDQIKDYLAGNKGKLSAQEVAGLTYLLDHLRKFGKKKTGKKPGELEHEEEDSNKETETADKKVKDATDKTKEKEKERDPLDDLEGILDPKSLKTLRAMKMNSFESMFGAFIEFIEDAISFRGETPFEKSADALDVSAKVLSELDMGEDHSFTREELTIIAKLTGSKEKRQVSWFARHFDGILKSFFVPPGKAKRKDVIKARNVFHALGLVRDRFDVPPPNTPDSRAKIEAQIRSFLANQNIAFEPQSRRSLEDLIHFMESRSGK